MMMMTMMTVPVRTIKRNNNVVKTKTKQNKKVMKTKKKTNKQNKFKLIINKKLQAKKQKPEKRKPHKKIEKRI